MATRPASRGQKKFIVNTPYGPVEVRRNGHIELDLEKIAAVLAPDIVGHIKRRTSSGKDIEDKRFTKYSKRYRKHLKAMGEKTKVDLWLTGGLMNSVNYIGKTIKNGVVTMMFAPDTGTSAAVTSRAGSGSVRPKSNGKKIPAATRTGTRGPSHNLVGKWLHFGTPKMPARPWLGVSPKGLERLMAKLKRLNLFKR